jgi:hypothetical protein
MLVLGVVRHYRTRRGYRAWVAGGKLGPPPHCVKQAAILEYARAFGIETLVETGTYLGDMVHAMRGAFSRIYSIELDLDLYRQAQRLFGGAEGITLLHGDSAKVLPDVLAELDRPAIFWLDGHYSAGLTAKGEQETPIMEELNAILSHKVPNHVVLADDARAFTGSGGYPSLRELRDFIGARRSGWVFRVDQDIIRIHEPHERLVERSR